MADATDASKPIAFGGLYCLQCGYECWALVHGLCCNCQQREFTCYPCLKVKEMKRWYTEH